MDTQTTRAVVEKYFTDLAAGDLPAALAALSPSIEFELPRDHWNAVIPYLGRHVGREAVERAFAVRAETTEVLDYRLLDLRADGPVAVARIYTKAAQTRTREVFEIEDAHVLSLDDEGRIAAWKVYFDPNGEVAAFNADRAERLVAAAWAGDVGAAGELLGAGAPVDGRAGGPLTPLMIAAGRADEELVRALLHAGANVHETDGAGGATPLHKACQGGSTGVARRLVEAGAFVDATTPTTGHTPLMDAIWYSYPDIVRLLLDRGAGVAISTHYGFSPQQHFEYELAVNSGGTEKMREAERWFTERKEADRRSAEAQRLMAAVVDGDTATAARLVAEGAAVDERFPIVNGFNDAHTPLLVASRDGHTAIVSLLLEAGADVNASEPTFGAVPLHKAVYNGHSESTAILAAHPGVALDVQGATNGYTPLHDAIWHGFADCARILVEAGASTVLRGHDGRTPHDLALRVFGADHAVTRSVAA